MVNPIQNVGGGAMMSQVGKTHMTESQKTSFQEIISRYDANNFSQTDFEAMGEELRQAGVGRTRETKSMLEDAGFSIDQFAKGGSGDMQRPGGPPPIQGGMDVEALQSFQEILENYDLTNMSSEDEESLMEQLTSSGILQSGLIINDYS